MRKRIIWERDSKNAKRLRLFVVRTGVKAGARRSRYYRALSRN